MRKQHLIALAALGMGVLGVIVWEISRHREPEYQGKKLTFWLEQYNLAQDIKKIGPVDEAIRAMGTNALPLLFAHITRNDPAYYKLLAKQRIIRRVLQDRNRFASPSMFALKALGADAKPLAGQLAPFLAQPDVRESVKLSLFFIGPAAIPALEQVCRTTNVAVRADAAWLIAKIQDTDHIGWGFGRHQSARNGQPMVYLGWAVVQGAEEHMVQVMVEKLEDPDPAIRLANIDSIRIYFPGSLGKPAAPTLVKALDDPEPGIGQAAREALKCIDPKAVAQAGEK